MQIKFSYFFKTKNIGLVSDLTELSGFNYAKLSYELNLYPDAINNMQTFLSDYPKSKFETEAKELLTDMFLRTNDYQKAINVIESIKSLSPSETPMITGTFNFLAALKMA